jgi:hypothetical protein
VHEDFDILVPPPPAEDEVIPLVIAGEPNPWVEEPEVPSWIEPAIEAPIDPDTPIEEIDVPSFI